VNLYSVLNSSSFGRRSSRSRRGIIAFTALVMLSVLVVVALSAMEEMALEARAARNRNDVRQAYLCAYTGIDYCLYLAGQSSTWRTGFGNGDWLSGYDVGSGAVTVSVLDPDGGAISSDPADPVQLTAAATCGLAKRTVEALAQPPPGLALKYVLCSMSSADLQLKAGVRVYGDLRTTGKVLGDSDVSLAGNIYTAPGQYINPFLIDADTRLIETSLTVPAPTVDFAWYNSIAQRLTPPRDGGNYVITDARLTPDYNPFGFTSPQGLYWLDAGGGEVHIENAYVIGTLIIINANKTRVRKGYYHTTYATKYPALLSDSDIEVEVEHNLDENGRSVDFNGDGDTNDFLVSRIRGVIYSTKKVKGMQRETSPGPFYFSGAVIADQLEISGVGFHVAYDPQLAETPVAGFQAPGLELIAGSIED